MDQGPLEYSMTETKRVYYVRKQKAARVLGELR